MKSKDPAAVALALALTAAAPQASAKMITVFADDFRLGRDVSNAVPGLTLARLVNTSTSGYSPMLSPVYPQAVYPGAANSPIQFGGTGVGGLQPFYNCSIGLSQFCSTIWTSDVVFEIVLDSPTDYFRIGGFHTADPIAAIAFNSAGELIAGFYLIAGNGNGYGADTGNGDGNQQVWFDRPQSDIARIWYGAADPSGVYGPTWLSWNRTSVPEPGTLVLLALGLVGIGVNHRRKAN